MKDTIEYLAIVVIAVAIGAWALQNQIGEPVMEFVSQTAKLISGGQL